MVVASFRSILVLIIAFGLLSNKGVTEKIDFGVYLGAEKVGKLSTTRLIEEKKAIYSLHSEVNISLLMDFNIVENIADVFENGLLIASTHTRHINNSLKAQNTIARSANIYVLTKDGKREKNLKEWISKTVTTLYFTEPDEKMLIYSQNYQKILRLKKTKPHGYEMALPDGKITTFEYINGKLKLVISNTVWGTIKFVREN